MYVNVFVLCLICLKLIWVFALLPPAYMEIRNLHMCIFSYNDLTKCRYISMVNKCFILDIEKEEIDLSRKESVLDVDQLGLCVPEDNARYHIFRFDHSYEGDYYNSVGTGLIFFNAFLFYRANNILKSFFFLYLLLTE